MSRLTVLHINIIGAVVVVLVAAALYFTIITGAQRRVADAERRYTAVKTEADQLPQALRALEVAKREKVEAEAQYSIYERQFMPAIGYRGRTTRLQVMTELFWPNQGRAWPERFIRTVRAHMNQQQRANGVSWENPGVLALGPFGPDPNAIQAGGDGSGLGPVLRYQFPMSVRGASLDRLMRHITDWSNVRGIGVPVVQGLQIVGNSPELQASYILSLTIILPESEVQAIPPANPRISGGGGRQMGMGMMGGMMPSPGGATSAGMGAAMMGPMPGAMSPPGGATSAGMGAAMMGSGPGGPAVAAPGMAAPGGGGARGGAARAD
ncbi:MAG TPA: hypothetical protein VLH79_09730 [Chthonomonadales bacterium]|nr:hypothetical protein [Chthonomonadales bacterium]